MNDSSDYVFKSSRIMAKLALKKDVEGPDNILQEENAYFDATHTRVHGFRSPSNPWDYGCSIQLWERSSD